MLLIVSLLSPVIGCVVRHPVAPVGIGNDRFGPLVIAVAPAINQSGSADFDHNRFADLMASELSFAEGVSTVPVSRVLAVLAARGENGVDSPEQALEVLRVLGADAILVFSVAEYDPYDPPSISITGQLYGTSSGQSHGASDPVALSRSASLARAPRGIVQRGLLAQTQNVFDASHGYTVDAIKTFAAARLGGASPYGWRKFVVSQQNFIRFCCYSTISQLLGWPKDSELAVGDPRAEGMP